MPTHGEIAFVAYARFEGRGCVHGKHLDDWLWAEDRLRADPDVGKAAAAAKTEVFVAEFYGARQVLRERYRLDADLGEIQAALMHKLGLQDARDLMHQRLTASAIADTVAGCGLAAWHAPVPAAGVPTPGAPTWKGLDKRPPKPSLDSWKWLAEFSAESAKERRVS